MLSHNDSVVIVITTAELGQKPAPKLGMCPSLSPLVGQRKITLTGLRLGDDGIRCGEGGTLRHSII